MAAPSYMRSPFGLLKRLKISPARTCLLRSPRAFRSTDERPGKSLLEVAKEKGIGPAHWLGVEDDSSQELDKSAILAEMEKELSDLFDEDPIEGEMESKSATLAEMRRQLSDELDEVAMKEAMEEPGLQLPLNRKEQRILENMPLPRSVQLTYLRPLRRTPEYGVPCADLQLRSFSIRNLEFFADFAMRVAYYLNLPARGPIPLPRITERWTVPRSNFVHKKSQENFERVTLRRLIQIQDGHPETVQVWLGYLERRAYYGIAMKANVWEYESLDVAKAMDESAENVDQELEEEWGNFGVRMNAATAEKVEELLSNDAFTKATRGEGVHGDMKVIGR